MKLPSTLDRRRRRGDDGGDGSADHDSIDVEDENEDDYDYAYLAGDEAGEATLEDEWEWVEVPDEQGEAPVAAPGARRGRFGRFLSNLLPLDDAPDDGHRDESADSGSGPDPDLAGALAAPDGQELDDDSWDDDWDEAGDDGLLRVDPRIAARRDGVEQARRSRLRRRLVSFAVVVGVIVGLGALTRSAVLDVDQIVVSGAERADEADIVAASGVSPGTPMLGLDLDQALAGVRDEPWVLDATADRTWSGTVSISVVERRPVATVNAGAGGWLLIDGERRVVDASATPPALPIIDGVGVAAAGEELAPDAQAAIDVAAALTPALRTRVAVVNGSDPGAIELTLQPSGTVRFGPATHLEERIRTLQTVFAQVDLLCLETINLQVPDSAVLTRVPACA